jgi:hypothetical protein
MEIKCLSSLTKVFSDAEPMGVVFTSAVCLRGERVSFQIAYRVPRTGAVRLQAADCTCFWVRQIPAGRVCYPDSDDWYLRKTAGAYPDLLFPAQPGAQAEAVADAWNALWCEIDSAGLPDGERTFSVTLVCATEERTAAFTLRVLPVALPPQTLLYTDWLHADCLATYYATPVFSERHWGLLAEFIGMAARHGMNLILTPLFTPPLDTQEGEERPTVQLTDVEALADGRYAFAFPRLARWVRICQEAGITHFELSHLFTQWGAKHAPQIRDTRGNLLFGWHTDADAAEYTDFLTQFAPALTQELRRLGILENCFLHVSDEPEERDRAGYARHAALLKSLFPDIKRMDALSELSYYRQGLLEQPIPANNRLEPFIGQAPHLWTYYCCGQHKDEVSNRFFAMPGARTRVLGLQMWKFRVEGFLHWGYNFWYSQFSKHAIDPYKTSDADGGFPAGDAYCVYPGADFTASPSLRLKIFYDALQDMRVMQAAEKKLGYAAALALLEAGLPAPLDFHSRVSEDWLLAARTRVARALL